MKKIILVLLGISIISFSSCDDWLDVTSKSEIRGEDHYNTVTGLQQTLTGCYMGMTTDQLYGKYLSWYLVELLAGQYYPMPLTSSSGLEYRIQNYMYTQTEAIKVFESIWAKAYSVIANANEGLKYIDQKRSSLDDVNYHVIKGELLAIRAYLHFDMLRLYGYGNWENRATELNSKLTIPYVKELLKGETPQLSGKETIALILADLKEAENLLKDYDPILGKHDDSFYSEANIDGYYNNRTIHLNYYAVRAIRARVLLWEGSNESKTEALEIAKEIILMVENGGIKQPNTNTLIYSLNADIIKTSTSSLAPENLFCLNINDISTRIITNIIPNYKDTDYAAMFIEGNDFNNIYETYDSEIRRKVLFNRSTNSSNLGYVPLKVYQENLIDDYYKNKISMIRIPEIYYIAAECYATGSTQDLQNALKMLNTVRESRGIYEKLENLDKDEVVNEIKKEYHKEFISEGLMFYYYKRTAAINVPHYLDIMGDKQYVLPYPEFEIQAGRVQ